MSRRAVERTEFTVSYTDIRIVEDNVINESDSITEKSPSQNICYKAHRSNIVRFDQSDAFLEAKPITLKYVVKNIANIGFIQKM
jgi:hypothetical protein